MKRLKLIVFSLFCYPVRLIFPIVQHENGYHPEIVKRYPPVTEGGRRIIDINLQVIPKTL
jgi:hypothetical protein